MLYGEKRHENDMTDVMGTKFRYGQYRNMCVKEKVSIVWPHRVDESFGVGIYRISKFTG